MGSLKRVEWSDRTVARFFAKVDEDPITGCWNWTAFCDPKGYGRFQYGARDARLAYNVSYGLMVGEVPEGLELDHLCRNNRCVNPYHLELVTSAVNMQRRAGLKTHCPSGHPYSPENSYRTPAGNTVCRTCRKRSQRVVKDRQKAARRERGPLPPRQLTHCQNGHPFDEANTYVHGASGRRRCRTCHNARQVIYNQTARQG